MLVLLLQLSVMNLPVLLDELTCVGFAVAVICDELFEGETRQVKVLRHLHRAFVLPKENQIFGSPAICAMVIYLHYKLSV